MGYGRVMGDGCVQVLVAHFTTRRPGESKSQEAAVSEGQDLHLRQEGQEGLVAEVAVAPRRPVLQLVVLLVGAHRVQVSAKLDLLGDGPRPSASDAQEAHPEGHDDAAPLLHCETRSPPSGYEGRIHASEGR